MIDESAAAAVVAADGVVAAKAAASEERVVHLIADRTDGGTPKDVVDLCHTVAHAHAVAASAGSSTIKSDAAVEAAVDTALKGFTSQGSRSASANKSQKNFGHVGGLGAAKRLLHRAFLPLSL